jgi:acyl-homoserine-lactone acylase
MRTPAGLLALLAFTLIAPCAHAGQATIYRDKFGVPSICASNTQDALAALGYATCRDSAERMALNYKFARGRMSEVEGRSDLYADGILRAIGFEDVAAAEFPRIRPDMRANIVAYCAGANRALAEQKGRLPGWIRPFTPTDVLALALFINSAFALNDMQNALTPFGSNQFAVAPSRSSTGHPILSCDPHLEWSGIFLWYEYALYTPTFQFRGISITGLPFPNMGHTNHIAWSMTNNDPATWTVYHVTADPQDPTRYNFHGSWRKFGEKRVEIKYLDNGELKTEPRTFKTTEWGPLLFGATALRLSMLSFPRAEQVFEMVSARNASEFRAALKARQVAMWNIVYADTSGNIGYQYNARLPRRNPLFDWRKAVPGANPDTGWGSLLDLDELPHVLNPRTGLLCNCNSSPWLTPLDDEIRPDWPAYVTTYGHTTRYDRLSHILASAGKISPERAKLLATDSMVPYAVPAVQALCEFGKSAPELQPALAVLGRWDGRSDVDSVGTGLYAYWLRSDPQTHLLAIKAAEGKGWAPSEAGHALSALKSAVETMKKEHGRLDIPWGEMHVMHRGAASAPVNGFGYVVPHSDESSVTPQEGAFSKGRFDCTEGSSFRMIISLDPAGVRSWSILPYGAAQNPSSPHYADQMPLFARGLYKETHFGVAGARKFAVSRQVLTF